MIVDIPDELIAEYRRLVVKREAVLTVLLENPQRPTRADIDAMMQWDGLRYALLDTWGKIEFIVRKQVRGDE